MRADFLTKKGETTVYLVLHRTENSAGDVLYNMMTIANNAVVYI